MWAEMQDAKINSIQIEMTVNVFMCQPLKHYSHVTTHMGRQSLEQ